jgi:hypothetical protein
MSDFWASIGMLDVCFIVEVAGECLGLEALGDDNAHLDETLSMS